MKTLYLECNMGAAGDMLMAALLELYPKADEFLKTMNSLGIPGVSITPTSAEKCGIMGTSISVKVNGEEEESIDIPNIHEHDYNHNHDHDYNHNHDHDHDHVHIHEYEGDHIDKQTHTHSHSGLTSITSLIEKLPLSQTVKRNATSVYNLIAQAESHAHGKPVEEVHFHEVGAMDAVVDIVGVCYLMELLSADLIIVSPINVGRGQVRTDHGILPVPTPATAHILKGVPTYSNDIRGELCTPTGAALLKHFANKFSNMPLMTVEAIGYGMGKKDFAAANCVRAFIGVINDSAASNGEIAELCCNLDDITPEALGFAMEILFENGALDVFTLPIYMKKSRSAFMLVCLCRILDSDIMANLILKHTTTIGVRKSICQRYTLTTEFSKVETIYGAVRIKNSTGYGLAKSKPEYEDVAKAARENDVSFDEVYLAAYRERNNEKHEGESNE